MLRRDLGRSWIRKGRGQYVDRPAAVRNRPPPVSTQRSTLSFLKKLEKNRTSIQVADGDRTDPTGDLKT